MASFDKQTDMKARFEKGELRTVNVSSTSYNNSLSFSSMTGDVVSLQLNSREDLKELLDACITAALKFKGEESYIGEYANLGMSDGVTIEMVKEWRSKADKWDDQFPVDTD